MPMPYKLQKYKEIAIVLLKPIAKDFFLFIGLFYPLGEPTLLHLLRCDPFAVDHHSLMGQASHLQQSRSRVGWAGVGWVGVGWAGVDWKGP
jgi:hypothetical protein